MAQGRAKPGVASALHLPVPEKFKLSNGLTCFTAKAKTAAGGGKSRSACRDRSEPGGSAGAREHDGADAAAGNGDAFGSAKIADRAGGFGSHTEFGRRDDTTGISTAHFREVFPKRWNCWRT